MPLALQIELLSKAEIDTIWAAKRAAARAENFADYLNFINAREVGDSFRVPVEKGDNNAANAREIRHNFNEAAKERTRGGTAAPVVLRWKIDKHMQKRTYKKDGKTVEDEIEVIDRVTALVVSTDAIKKRGPRAKKDEQASTAETPTNGTVSADTAKSAETTPSAA